MANEPAGLWRVDRADCLDWLNGLPEGAADLLMSSPPYELARTYAEGGEDLGIARDTEAWVSWMTEVCIAARRVCKGLCVFVVEGQTHAYRYSAGPLLLAADLHRRGFHLRKPPIYRRVGIPGSGGPDWLRNDWEWCLAFTRGGKLPWSDNTALGHPPKWGPGGEMSHRLSDGTRVNQWGKTGTKTGVNGAAQRTRDGGRQKAARPSHKMTRAGCEDAGTDLFGEPPPAPESAGGRNEWGMQGGSGMSRADGKRRTHGVKRGATRGYKDGDTANDGVYEPPVLANPGNVINELYTAEQVAVLLGEPTDILDCKAGGGQMGNELCHENEAPYPERLVEFFVRSFCPSGGLVIDCFSGSGTTGAVAVRWGRRFAGCDLRESQVLLSRKRIAQEVDMFHALEGPADA